MEAPGCQSMAEQIVGPRPGEPLVPDPGEGGDMRPPSAPRCAAIEEELRSILARCLRCPIESLPPSDESLVGALQIDSILFLELIVAVEDAFEQYIPLDVWLEERIGEGGTAACTLSSLAQFVERELGPGTSWSRSPPS